MRSTRSARRRFPKMKQYDTNGNGNVAGAELNQAPSLRAALDKLDANGDQGVSAEEVTARIATML